jgi:hypothetical protein
MVMRGDTLIDEQQQANSEGEDTAAHRPVPPS